MTEPPDRTDRRMRRHRSGVRIQQRFEGLLAYSRLLALIPVVFLLLDAAGSFIYGADILVRTAGGDFGEPSKVGGRLGIFLIVMDTFLVGATLMIAAFGFYELFVLRRERTMHKYWLPNWLQMRDLEDLKARVVSMLILVAAITFVDLLVEARGPRNILFLGAGIAVIIIALSAFLRFGRKPRTADDADDAGRAADHPAPSNPAGDQGQSPAGQLRRPGRSKTPGLLERRHRGLRQPAGQVQGRDQRRRGLRQASEGQVQGRDQRRRRAVRRH